MNRLIPAAGGLAAGLALLQAGCGSGLNADGPFGNSASGSLGMQCSWVPRGMVGTFGELGFPNKGGPAHIDKVTLGDPQHLQVVAEWVVPISGHDLIGVLGGYPPLGSRGQGPSYLAPGILWNRRQHADGATIPHWPYPRIINLVLVLRATGVKGTATTVYVYYTSGGTSYRLDLASGIELYNGNPRGCLDEKTA
jgi:hypothetical protein